MRFGILGPLTVDNDGIRVEITAPKQRAVLILLLLEAGHVVPADVILDRLWLDDPPTAGLRTVRFHISKLRQVLEPEVKGSGFKVLESRDAGYVIDPMRHEIDTRRFDRLASEGQREIDARPDRAHRMLSEALSLWRGSALQDVAYEEFAVGEARRLEARKLAVTEDRIACELRLGRTAGIVAELQELATNNPLRERTTELLMQALYAGGRSADAVAAAQTLRRHLGELGLEPPPSLVHLEERILIHDQSLAAPTRPAAASEAAPLPGRLTSFIGRRSELRSVKEAVNEKRLVTLIGPPGAGKTRLALETGRQCHDFDAGVAWVELGDIGSAGLVPQAFGAALGIVAPLGADYAELVVDQLRDQTKLIVVDNCEHLLGAAARLIVSILESCSSVRVLATSREALGVPGEHTWIVPPFELPADVPEDIEMARDIDSIHLFVDRALEADSRFHLTKENVSEIAAICRRLDGLPLAIELAASATEALTVSQILDRLDHRFVRVPGTQRHGTSRQTTMEEAVRWSYDMLDSVQQTIFVRLSVFAGGFTMEAAESVAGWGRVDRDAVFDAVLHLVHKSLLVTTRTTDRQVRYRMLMVLRQFGQRELQAEGEARAIDERHAEHFAEIAESIAPHLEGPTASRASQIADIELDNFRAAMKSSIGNGRSDLGLRIDAALTWYWYWRSYIAEGKNWGTRILAKDADPEPSAPRAQVLYAVGMFQTIVGEFAEGNTTFERAADMARELGMEALEARTMTGRGVNARDRGRLASALDYLTAAADIDRRIGDTPHLALTLRFVGVVHFMLGDLASATAALDETYELSAKAGHQGGMGWALEGKVRVAFRSGDDDAYALAAQAAELYAQVHDRRNQAWLLIRTALARLLRNDLAAASADLAESRALFIELSDRRGIAYAEQHLGMIELAQRRFDRAEARLQAALERFETMGEEGGRASSYGWLTVLAVLRGDLAGAAACATRWLELPSHDRYVWSVLDILNALAEATADAEEQSEEAAPRIAGIGAIRDQLAAALDQQTGIGAALDAVDRVPELLGASDAR